MKMTEITAEQPRHWTRPEAVQYGTIAELTLLQAIGKTCPGGPDVWERTPPTSTFAACS